MDDRELQRARWATFSALLLVFAFYLFSAVPWKFWISGIVAFLTASLLTAVLELWLRPALRNASSGQKADDLHAKLTQAHLRTQATLNLQNKLLQAHSEKEILEAVMQIGTEFLGAIGVSFVPYDEWGQSLPALVVGKAPETALQAWSPRLIQPETRQVCKNCQLLHGGSGCVLIPSESTQPAYVECFPLRNGGRDLGMLNFYFERDCDLEGTARTFFVEILDVAGQALENLRSRDQEIAALHYLQTISSPKSDLSILLTSLLENVQHAMDVDFALLYLPGGIPGQINPTPQLFSRSKGEAAAANFTPDLPFLEGIWKSVLASGNSLSLENATLDKQEKWKVLLIVPLIWRGELPAGMLILGSNSAHAFAQRHRALLETLAGQAALLIQNARLMVQVEYQAVVDERTRLAREIHDGLAQTLAFLKIQSTQMQNYLARGETEKLTNTLQASHRTLSDAYVDARQAIDDLRRTPSTSLRHWIGQVAADYEQATGQRVNISAFTLSTEYPANIQAQLIRIIQEALSNIRKHADARVVDIFSRENEASVLIEIRDDGCGFAPENVDGSSRYGLRGMRERAESIGADFQITSHPGGGTIVSLSLPVPVKEEL